MTFSLTPSVLKSIRHYFSDYCTLLVAFLSPGPDHTNATIHDEQYREGVTAVIGKAGRGPGASKLSDRVWCKFSLAVLATHASAQSRNHD